MGKKVWLCWGGGWGETIDREEAKNDLSSKEKEGKKKNARIIRCVKTGRGRGRWWQRKANSLLPRGKNLSKEKAMAKTSKTTPLGKRKKKEEEKKRGSGGDQRGVRGAKKKNVRSFLGGGTRNEAQLVNWDR